VKIRHSAAGIHLFDRDSGVNILLDEFVPPEATWATAPRQVSIALTNACDLSCAYCFAPKYRAVLSFDQIVAWAGELDAAGTLGLGFGGGEPTLYKRFPELCVQVARCTRLAVTFTTHGHHLTDRALAMLSGNVHMVRVSVDGVGQTYERLRRRSFKGLRQRLEIVREYLPLGINVVVNRDTIADLDAVVTLATEVHASELLLLPEQPVDGRVGIDSDTVRQLRGWVAQYSGGPHLAISERGAEGVGTCEPLPREVGLRAYAHIDAKGVLKRASYEPLGVPIGADGVMAAIDRLETQAS
jgi:sulfatase maturation enzyme AslB (radical SAM superfamily)